MLPTVQSASSDCCIFKIRVLSGKSAGYGSLSGSSVLIDLTGHGHLLCSALQFKPGEIC